MAKGAQKLSESRVAHRSDGSHDGQAGGGTALMVAKDVQRESWKKKPGKPRDLTENRHSDSLKKGQITLLRVG